MRNEPVFTSDLSWLSSVDQLFIRKSVYYCNLQHFVFGIITIKLYIIFKKLFSRSNLEKFLLEFAIINHYNVYANAFDILSNRTK